MGDRTTRFWTAVLLTGMDITFFEHFFGVIWLAWSRLAWFRFVLFPSLAQWTCSAAVLRLLIYIYYNLRQLIHERRYPQTVNVAPTTTELREDGDV
jgi:hypothetical protein